MAEHGEWTVVWAISRIGDAFPRDVQSATCESEADARQVIADQHLPLGYLIAFAYAISPGGEEITIT
jgi:hypothetical protein